MRGLCVRRVAATSPTVVISPPDGRHFVVRQAVCEWGRDSVESWGRRRRSVSGAASAGNDTSESSEDMTQISQEILVLDFGDEKQSQFLKSNEPQFTDFNRGKLASEDRFIVSGRGNTGPSKHGQRRYA